MCHVNDAKSKIGSLKNSEINGSFAQNSKHYHLPLIYNMWACVLWTVLHWENNIEYRLSSPEMNIEGQINSKQNYF